MEDKEEKMSKKKKEGRRKRIQEYMTNKKIDKKDSTYVYMESSEKKTKMGQREYNKNYNSRKLSQCNRKRFKITF